VKDQLSLTQDEPWWAVGLTPRPGGNPPDIPPDYLYDPESNVYWNPRKPRFIPPRTTPAVIDRRVLSNGEIEEWERPRTIPDDFIYDPETHSYYAPGEVSTFDAEAFHQETMRIIEEVRREPPIPPEKLRVPPGTLDVPPAWRKSLGGERQRDLFSDLSDDDAPPPEKQ
jgi:hypothetical protein